MTTNRKPKVIKIDYTLEQFQADIIFRTDVNNILDRIANTLDRLDRRVSKLEKKKCL